MKTGTKQEKEELKKAGSLIMDLLGIKHYTVEWYWHDHAKQNEPNCTVDIGNEKNYRLIYLNVFPAFWRMDKQERIPVILHEFCHHITEDQYRCALNMANGQLVTRRELEWAREHETETIKKIIEHLIIKGASDALKKLLV